MKIIFGITSRNCINYTRLCLHSFQLYKPKDIEIELVLCDNDSSDGTPELYKKLEAETPNVRAICQNKNYGTPRSFNNIFKVFDETKADLCFFSNNDVVFSPNYIQNMLAFYQDFPECGLFSSTCIDAWGVGEGNTYKWFNNPTVEPYEPKVDPDWERYAAEFREKDKHSVIDGINACTFAVTRECRQAVGNFNEDYIIGCYDDCEYCVLAEKAGFRILNTSNAISFHFGGLTQSKYQQEHGNNSYQQHNKQVFERKFGISLDALGATCCRSLFWRKINNTMERVCI